MVRSSPSTYVLPTHVPSLPNPPPRLAMCPVASVISPLVNLSMQTAMRPTPMDAKHPSTIPAPTAVPVEYPVVRLKLVSMAFAPTM